MCNVKKIVVGSLLVIGGLLGSFYYGEVLGQVGQMDMEEISQVEADQIANKAVIPYIHALQQGDVQTIERLIDGQLALTLGKLLRENQAYPNFLRKRYGSTALSNVIRVFQEKNLDRFVLQEKQKKLTAIINLDRPEGGQQNIALSLAKDQQGNWKIVDQK